MRQRADLDPNRSTRLLSSEDAETVWEVYRLLGDPAVQGNRALQTALRRLVFSGSRSLPKDRLVDLMTGVEALFSKHAGIRSRSKGVHIAEKSRLEELKRLCLSCSHPTRRPQSSTRDAC